MHSLRGDSRPIRNNLFYQWRGEQAVSLANFSGFSNSKIIFEYNSFLSTDQIALKEPGMTNIAYPGFTFNPEMIVANNYWGTTDTSVIDSMIYDRNDDLNHWSPRWPLQIPAPVAGSKSPT